MPTMTAALFGLVGVIVGALLSAGLAYLQARRLEERDTKAIIRLLSHEMSWAKIGYNGVLKRGLWRNNNNAEGLVEVWEKHRELLARQLTDHEWSSLADAMRFVLGMERLTTSSNRGAELTDQDKRAFTAVVNRIDRAERALATRSSGGEAAASIQRD